MAANDTAVDGAVDGAGNRPQIYLISPPDFTLETFSGQLARVLDQVETACVRLALAGSDEDRIGRACDALRQIAPPPTARSILQSLVRGHRRPDPATLPFEPTGRAGGDTVRLAAPKAPPTSTPVPAGPNEETRTAVATRDPATSTVPDAPIPTETRTVFEPVAPSPLPAPAPPRWPLVAIGLGSVAAIGAAAWWLLR